MTLFTFNRLRTVPREPSSWPRCRRKRCARRGGQMTRIEPGLYRCTCGAEAHRFTETSAGAIAAPPKRAA